VLQLEAASLAEFGVVPTNGTPSKGGMPPRQPSDSTPIRPAGKSSNNPPATDSQAFASVDHNMSSRADAIRDFGVETPQARHDQYSSNFHSGSGPESGSRQVLDSSVTQTPIVQKRIHEAISHQFDLSTQQTSTAQTPASPVSYTVGESRSKAPEVPDTSVIDTDKNVKGMPNYIVAENLLLHASDSVVKPIVGNRAIEVTEANTYKPASLTFTPLAVGDAAKLPPSELDAHLQVVFKALHKGSQHASGSPSSATVSAALMAGAITERNNMLSYISSIVSSSEVSCSMTL
jgi:hypothetical protein